MIYFLKAEQDSGPVRAGSIKIGTTIRLSQRVKQIAVDLGHMPTVLGVMKGGYAEEKALHEKFAEWRTVGEWFEPTMHMAGIIEKEARPWNGADAVIKADRALIAKAKYVAEMRGIPLAEYVTDVMKNQVERDFAKVVRENGGSPTATDVK